MTTLSEPAPAVQDQSQGTHPFPINRVVAFLGPYISLVSGALAAWLVQHFPGMHLQQGTVAATITQGIVFVIGALITWALQHKWLDGWQKWEGNIAKIAAGELPETAPAGTYDPTAFVPALPPGDGPEGELPMPADGPEEIEVLDAPGPDELDDQDAALAPTPEAAVLPSAQQEFASTPQSPGAPAQPPRPENAGAPDEATRPDSAVTPDEPVDELEPTEY